MSIQVISGFEEARLIYLGVLQALPIFDKKILLIDIGGGSTEFLIGKEGEVIEANSLKIGAMRMTNRFLGEDPIDMKSVKQCRQYVKAYLNPMTREVRKHGFESGGRELRNHYQYRADDPGYAPGNSCTTLKQLRLYPV